MISHINNPQSKYHQSAWLCLIFVAIALRLICFQGYSDSDPGAYSVLANDLAQGILHIPNYDGPPVFPLRLGVYAPTAVIIKFFGLSELTLVAYPFVISILGCMVAYILAKRLFCPLAGLISMAILAALPFELTTASVFFPDPIAAFWANLGVLFILNSLSRKASAYALLGGLCLGLSWLCKESVAYLAPFIAILCLQSKTVTGKISTLSCVGLGGLAILAIELFFYQTVTGDPLFRVHATERNYVQAAVWFFDQSSPYFGWQEGAYTKALINRLFIDGPASILRLFSLLPALATIAIIWAIRFRKRSFLTPGIWLLTLMLMYNFMSSSFQAYRPLPLFERYLYPLMLPAVLLFSGLIASQLQLKQKQQQFLAWILIGGFSLIIIPELIACRWSKPEQLERQVAAQLSAQDIIYSDYRTTSSLVFFRNHSLQAATANTIPYENLQANTMMACAYVLIDQQMSKFLTTTYKYQQPPFVITPPANWRSIWTKNNAVLFYIDGESCKQPNVKGFKG